MPKMPSLADYDIVSSIGSGSYGTCKKIRRKKDGKILVWKELDYGMMSDIEKQMLVSEVNLLRELKHEHIVLYYDRIIDRGRTKLYIIMEYCEGGDLATTITSMKKEGRQIDEEYVWRIGIQILLALKVCHSRLKNGKAVLHRDLKPANVFLDANKNVKIGDFGLARVLNHDTSFAKTFVGTPYYMSPEQMNYMSYNEKSDVWSVGCLLYELCALRPPFMAANQKELASRITTGRFARIPLRYSDNLNLVISTLLKVDESQRPTIEEMLQHPLIVPRLPATKSTGEARRSSATVSRDEGYSSRMESLRKSEELLVDRQRELRLKEKELESRERAVSLKEKLAEDKMIRADKLMRESTEKLATLNAGMKPWSASCDLSDSSEDDDKPQSCLAKYKRPPESPKKKVSFSLDKENDGFYMRKLSGFSHNTEQEMELEKMKCLLELQDRLLLAKRKSDALRKIEYDSNYRARHLLSGIR